MFLNRAEKENGAARPYRPVAPVGHVPHPQLPDLHFFEKPNGKDPARTSDGRIISSDGDAKLAGFEELGAV